VILYSFGVISSDGWTESEMSGFATYTHEGTLLVTLVNPKTNKSVWLGLAKQAIGSEERALVVKCKANPRGWKQP
jgi:hypothetical protein